MYKIENNNNSNAVNNNRDTNNNDDEDDEDEDDFTQSDYFQLDCRAYSHLSPLLVVLDFDHTLAVTDVEFALERDVSGKFRSIYARPFLYNFLDFIKSVNKNNVLILWTAGMEFYINHALLLLNIAQYFDHVLSRKQCDESKKDFGKKKSHRYLIRKFPQYRSMRSIIVDNFALHNSARSGYSAVISIKPFNFSDIVRGLGGFNVSPFCISDVYEFLKSKGERGKSTIADTGTMINSSYQLPNYGDTALLNLIRYTDKEFFHSIENPFSEKQSSPVVIRKLYRIEDEDEKGLQITTTSTTPPSLYLTDFTLGEPVMMFFCE